MPWDKQTGLLRKARGLLTDESDDPPERIAERYLERNSRLLSTEEGSVLDHLELVQTVRTPAGHRLSYQQHVGPVPVHGGRISVDVTDQGQVYRLTSDYRPDAARVDLADAGRIGVGESIAREIAVKAVEGRGRLRRDPEARLVIVAERGRSQLAWQVVVVLASPPQSWEILVDADNGQVLDSTQTVMTDSEGSAAGW
jgi:Zn-dependent metalloprotease